MPFIDDNDPDVRAAREEYESTKGKKGERPPAGRRFDMMRLSQIEFDTSPRWLVDELIPRDGIVLAWGAPKSGKTFWTFDLVGHIALGRDYCGRTVEKGSVIYVACEGEYGVKTRAVAFREERAHGEDPPLYLMSTRLDLIADVDELIAAIAAQLAGDPVSVIVLDTLNRSFVGSESKDEDMSAYVAAADRLRAEFEGVVVIVHHCGIAGERPRGHTSLTGAVDTQIAVKRDADDSVLVTFELMKDGAQGMTMRCRLKPVDVGADAHGKMVTSCVVEHIDAPATPTERKRTPKLTPAQKLALKMLHEAIGAGGEIPPTSNHIPPNTRCIDEDLWRRYCYQGGISTGGPDAKRIAFTRAADALIGNDRVGAWDSWVWPT